MMTESIPITVDFIYSTVINFALQQNHVPVIRRFVIKNESGKDIQDIRVWISCEPEVATKSSVQIALLHTGETIELNQLDIKLSAKYLSELTERIAGRIMVSVQSGEQLLFKEEYTIDVLAFDEWQGISILPETISSFVTPNNPHIAGIVSRAAEFLKTWTGSPSLDEYQTMNPDRVKKQMAAVFEAIREYHIVYCTPPASFEETGQRVRMIDTLLSQKIGTCLDMTLLYASCLEAIGIRPIIVVIKGHAFAGGWLVKDAFANSVNDDPALLSKRIAEGMNEILLVETTCLNEGNSTGFDDAVKAANYHLVQEDNFLLFVDVRRSRFAGIRPLPQRVKTETGWEFVEPRDSGSGINTPEEITPMDPLTLNLQNEVSKQQLWERKLLDLSLRNNLLNTRITKSTIQIISVNLNLLEDALAAGDEFQILSKPTDWENPLRKAGIYQAMNQTDPMTDLVKHELEQRHLRTYLTDGELGIGLTNLYRASRLSLEENGANTLYLCLGLLKWYETPTSEQPRYAPILLLPVEIIRKSALKGYVIRSREEETILNITLLEMLRQDFKITIPGLDPLPRDESGVDVKRIFNIIRKVIMPQTRWNVEEQAILGTFSFSKFIMWNDIHNNAEKLIQNKVVASLVMNRAMWDVKINQFVTEDLDKQYRPSELVLPISADSSQLEAVSASGQDKSFILHGPPGTGKSQTITNIIANALYNGKKVLFVAEKMAALTVVQRRLEAVGIAPFSLELHSNKSKKSYILEQLKRTSEIVATTPPENFIKEADRIHQIRSELNSYVESLHKKYPFGFSLYEAFSGYASSPSYSTLISLNSDNIERLTPELITQWTDIAEQLSVAGTLIVHPHNHPLSAIKAQQYSTQLKVTVVELFKTYSESLDKLEPMLKDCCTTLCITDPVNTRHQADIIVQICEILLSIPDIPPTLIGQENIVDSIEQVKQISGHALNRNRLKTKLLSVFHKEVLQADARMDRNIWSKADTKWFLPRLIVQQRVIKSYKALAVNGKFDKSGMRNFLDEIILYQEEQSFIQSNSVFPASLLGQAWQDGEGNWEEILQVCDAILKLNELLISFFNDPLKSSVCRRSISGKLKDGFKSFISANTNLKGYREAYALYLEVQKRLHDLLLIDFDDKPSEKDDYITTEKKHCIQWKTGVESLRDWVAWNQTKNHANANGMTELVKFFESGVIQNQDVVPLLLKSIYHGCADYIMSQDEKLSSFNGKLFEEKIRKFRELNRQFEELTKQELYAKLAGRIPSFTREAASSSEIGILQRNIRNNGRGTSIRKLFDTIPALLTRMCPCMLMSPISVAQYIDVNNFKFDLIVFDEASQMPTCEAVGAVARGNTVIVVGDPKQMPPTSFFSTNNLDEENLEKEDLESILDDCLALSLPSKHLQWHYRSKHESLIAFSNSHFYENSLLTFPSPDDQTTKVQFVSVGGYYDRGKTRQNSFEARAVVDEIIHRLSDPVLSKKSIGVVTFSSVQQTLVDDLLNEAFMLRPDLELIATETHEPIFIKNLENVQGDERDVILFSVGYGPDKEGKVNLNFGPLNREGGWRRLNVAVSRARYEMKVFSTLKADQIDITRTAAKGVIALKAFLDFAEKGKKAMAAVNGIRNHQNSGVTDHLARRLREEGILVNTHIGCSGFKIDIGIINPEMQSEYLLGILCDGQSYKESKTAKDREIVQVATLHLLGWQIHKVWSCDWWDSPEKVLDEIKQAIEKQKTNKSAKQEHEEVLPETSHVQKTLSIQPGKTEQVPPKSKHRLDYTACTLKMRNSVAQPEEFLSYTNKPSVIKDIQTVLEIESPVSKDLLCRRVLAAWSLTRIGTRIDACFESLFKEMNITRTGKGTSFFWRQEQRPEDYHVYRTSANDTEKRDAADIPPEELSNAVREILENQISLNREELVKEVARIFGFGRLGTSVESCMNVGIDKAVSRGFARIEGGRVYSIDNSVRDKTL